MKSRAMITVVLIWIVVLGLAGCTASADPPAPTAAPTAVPIAPPTAIPTAAPQIDRYEQLGLN